MEGASPGDFWKAWTDSPSILSAMAPIPDHKPSGLLPPFLGSSPIDPALMSPYLSTPEEFVCKFGTSDARRRILAGYLDHRAAIRRTGLTIGFQWLDGSFADRMEREPNDIDIVTFFVAPKNWDPLKATESNPDVFNSQLSKAAYKCDAYFVSLNELSRKAVSRLSPEPGCRTGIGGRAHGRVHRNSSNRRRVASRTNSGTFSIDPVSLVELTAYWFGLFSHQRETYAWRGIVSVSLASEDNDSSAREMINIMADLT